MSLFATAQYIATIRYISCSDQLHNMKIRLPEIDTVVSVNVFCTEYFEQLAFTDPNTSVLLDTIHGLPPKPQQPTLMQSSLVVNA
jgi:hypothetical protein